MLEAPPDLTAGQIACCLRDYWGIAPTEVEYAPLGHGSENWTVRGVDGQSWFVKADRSDLSEQHRATYQTAADLRDAGLDVVHAAVRDRSGQLRRSVAPGWDLAVFGYIDGRNPDFTNDTDRARIAAAVGRLHAHRPFPTVAPRWAPGLGIAEVEELLVGDLERSWSTGPCGEHARELIQHSAPGIRRLIDLHNQLAKTLAASGQPWVITHGEPDGGNTMITTSATSD